MKPVFDDFTPFSIEHMFKIRQRRQGAIEDYFANRDKPKKRTTTTRKPREVRLDAGAKAALDKLPLELRNQVMEAMRYANGNKPNPGKEGSQ